MKKLITSLMIIMFASFVYAAYSPPSSSAVDLVLNTGYTPLTQYSVDLILTGAATAGESCTCAGLDTNWEINNADYCNITVDCNLGTGTLSFTGSGETRCYANINSTDLGDPKSGGTLFIYSNCSIEVKV